MKSLSSKHRSNSPYMYLDTLENAIDSLEHAVKMLNEKENMKWKWIIIALHHSLYSFCVLNLVNGNYDNVLSNGRDEDNNTFFKGGDEKWKKSKIKKRLRNYGYTIEWEEINYEPEIKGRRGNPRKNKKLIEFWKALARVQDGECWMGKSTISKPLILSDSEWEGIEFAVDIRNELIHFIPKGHSIEIELIKEKCFHLMRPIDFLAFKTGHSFFFLNESDKLRTRSAISDLIKGLTN